VNAACVFAIAFLCGGCDQLFKLDRVELSYGDAGTGDGDVDRCFTDTFTADTIDPRWIVDMPSPTSLEQVDGRLAITAAITPGAVYASIFDAYQDLTESIVEVELVELPNSVPGSESGMSIQANAAHRYMFLISSSGTGLRLTFRRTVSGMDDNPTVPLDPASHRFLRFRHTGNTLFWETSADRTGWMVQRALSAPPVPLDTLSVQLFHGTYRLVSSEPGTVEFDNLRIGCGP
jgi:hypothetical protein